MDPIIIGAIIGGVATVMSAIIGVLIHNRKVVTSKQHFEKSKALRLGYVLAAIECYLDAQRHGITSVSLSDAIKRQSKRAHEIARTLGISASHDENALIEDLSLKIDTKPITIKNAFRIGNIVGRVYFYAISLMATGSLPVIEEDIERLSEAEELLNAAGLASDFLEPVKKLWKEKLRAARDERDFSPIDNQMEETLDQLCKSIEIGARHIA